jgi:hypothetical protein
MTQSIWTMKEEEKIWMLVLLKTRNRLNEMINKETVMTVNRSNLFIKVVRIVILKRRRNYKVC